MTGAGSEDMSAGERRGTASRSDVAHCLRHVHLNHNLIARHSRGRHGQQHACARAFGDGPYVADVLHCRAGSRCRGLAGRGGREHLLNLKLQLVHTLVQTLDLV